MKTADKRTGKTKPRPPELRIQTVDLLYKRPDLKNLFPIADIIDEATRWGV